MPRPKGLPRTGGRQVGTRNKRTLDGEQAARAIVDDPEVRAQWLRQARDGTLSPDLIKMFFAYAYGKPYEVPGDADSDSPRTITLQF